MIDLDNSNDIARLYASISANRELGRPFRQNRVKMLREFVGRVYDRESSGVKDKGAILVNLMGMTADVYTLGLAAENPRCMVTSPFRDLTAFAYRWQQGLNNYIKEIHLAETMQEIVLDAMFTWGIAKVFQAEKKIPVQLEDDVWADLGRPYICRISPDNFVVDMQANERRRCRFMLDEYRVSWESVEGNFDFDRKVVAELSPTSRHDRGEDQANDISGGDVADENEYSPGIDLMDVWLPEIKAVATFPRHSETKPLKVVDEGLEGGPYQILSFSDVPDNVMPSAPMQNLYHLHLLYNQLSRRHAIQALEAKTNHLYAPAAARDADRRKKAAHGEFIKSSDPRGVTTVITGGVDQAGFAFGETVLDLFSRAAGNLDAQIGLGPQAKTFGQEQLIHQAVSRKEAKMQNRTHCFVAGVLQSLGHLMWEDVILEVPATVVAGSNMGIRVDASWTPEMREGDFLQYNFDIEPYSMNYEPPEAKVEKIERVIAKAVELHPLLEAAGGSIDVQEVMRHYVDALGRPELASIVTFANPSQRPGPQGSPPTKTTREYVRRNIAAGPTPQARRQILQQTMMAGGQANPQQRAMAGGSV